MNALQWALTAASIAGNVLVIKKQRAGQFVWMLSNIGWVTSCAALEQWPQVALFSIYLGLSVWGWWEWGRNV
jgi:hypothetical protein